ncbi:MAG: S-layer homology domain-containing protein, partial [Bacillota bacterium]|nr:S-layer homology domain-containing protein [Bacillota bacterium]
MKRKELIQAVSLLLVLFFVLVNVNYVNGVSNDPALNSIFNGQEPTIKLVNDKISSLVSYSSKKFKDIKAGDWYTNNLSKLVGLNGIDGYNDGTFKPKNPIKTAEFIKLMLAAAGYRQELDKDVWYKNYITKAKELGIVEDSDGYVFDESMIRKDMAKMICKMLKLEPQAAGSLVFSDASGIDTKWIDTAFNEYLIRGYYSKKARTFKPLQTATRAEVTEMIVRALEYRDNPEEYRVKMKAYYKEIEREQDLTDGTYVMPPLTQAQRSRLNSYPENQKVETNVMSGQYMSNKEVVKHFTQAYLMDLIRKAKGYIEADNNVDYHVVDLTYKNEAKKYLSTGFKYIDKNGKKVSQDDELDKVVKW